MSDRTPDDASPENAAPQSTDPQHAGREIDSAGVHDADVRNGEPDALEGGSHSHARTRDDDPDQRLQPDDDLDVTEPTDEGEPIHHAVGGDIGEGAD